MSFLMSWYAKLCLKISESKHCEMFGREMSSVGPTFLASILSFPGLVVVMLPTSWISHWGAHSKKKLEKVERDAQGSWMPTLVPTFKESRGVVFSTSGRQRLLLKRNPTAVFRSKNFGEGQKVCAT